jgi:hypothetical protein
MLHKLVCICLLLLSTELSVSQSVCNQAALDKAAWLTSDQKYQKAISTLEASLAKHPNCAATYIRLSDLYYRMQNPMLAISCCNKAISLNSSEGVNATVFLHKQMLHFKQDSTAAELLRATSSNSSLSASQQQFLLNQYQQISTKISLQASPSNSTVNNLGDSINSEKHQTFPTISADGKLLIFTSIAQDINEDLHYSTYDTCLGWRKLQNLGYPPNTGDPEAAPNLSADSRYLFFTRCNTVSERGYDGGGCDVIYSYWQNDSGWSSPQIFGATVNTAAYEGQACINAQGNQLYFVSNRNGGYGGKDIYVTSFINGYWREPKNLGPQINTAGDEGAPFIHADNKHFYFSSNGHKGLGKADLFFSTKSNDSTYGQAVNLGAPINSEQDENSISVASNGVTAYFSSTKQGGMGQFDIYQCNLPVRMQSNAQVLLFGRVIDKYAKEILRDYEIRLLDTNGKLIEVQNSNVGDASYKFIVPANTQFYIEVETTDSGYQAYRKKVDTKQAQNNLLNKHLKLERFDVVDTILSMSYTDSNFADTNIRVVAYKLREQQFDNTDSIVVRLDVTENSFIDTNMLNTYCFSDSGRLDYIRYIDDLQTEKKKQNEAFITFYKNYLQEQKIPKLKVLEDISHKVIDSKELLNINISVLEYY